MTTYCAYRDYTYMIISSKIYFNNPQNNFLGLLTSFELATRSTATEKDFAYKFNSTIQGKIGVHLKYLHVVDNVMMTNK